MKLFNNLKRIFGKKQYRTQFSAGMQASGSQMAEKMIGMLAKTQEQELSCDEVFALLDQFTEMAARGEDVTSLMPMVQQHLEMCGDCREEYQALMNVITAKS
jgi:predicted component of type VI protein secretion system